MTDADRSKREADQRTIVALMMVAAVAIGLLGVMALVLPHLLGVVLIVAGIGLFALFHYVVWGWWLGGYLRRLEERDQVKESEVRAQKSADQPNSDF